MFRVNIINAINNLYTFGSKVSSDTPIAHNLIQAQGEPLEKTIKKIFLDHIPDTLTNKNKHYFSYQGSANNPPDLKLKGGDIVEIKKIQSHTTPSISLNSSWPRDKMNKDDPKINQQCRDCEKWIEADLFYAIGVLPKDHKETFSLFFLHGECMNAPTKFYEKFYKNLQTDIAKLSYNFHLETKELGRLNKIDPLGNTHLRIRGMFGMPNPFRHFNFCKVDQTKKLNIFCLMTKEKYNSFKNEDRDLIEQNKGISKDLKKIKSPVDIRKYIECFYIHFAK